jgi:site-specific DNA-methyltransferase (adenine-specific)
MKKIKSNSIDLIYCDILYGTGNDFNNYKDLKAIKEDINGHYIPRINEMYRTLKETGTIYLQMDKKINHWIRLVMDDIFGYDNFRNEIIWFYNSGPRKKNCFGNRHDTVLRYTKSNIFTFNEIREPYSEHINKPKSKLKYYHPDDKVIGDVWKINILGQNDKTERCGYSTQKPLELIERIIKSSSNENDLIADFYLGSGTTAIACKKLNRNFIGCNINKEAIKITNKRLNKGLF